MKINKLVKFVINQGFNGEIPIPVVYTFKDAKTGAKVCGYSARDMPHGIDGCQIEHKGLQFIAINVTDTWEMLLDTVVHELCHVWQDANNMPTDHGKKFEKKMKKVFTRLETSV